MSVSVEQTSNLGRRLTIEVPAANIQVEETNRLKDLAKNLRVDGFRPGKVSPDFIKDKYGKKIRQDAVSKVLQESLNDALKEQNMRPASRPNVEDLHDKEGENLKYVVSFEVYPEINLKDFSAITLDKDIADITAEDVESGVKKLQDQFAIWQDVTDRPAQNGDKLIIDFVGLLDGEPFEHGSANDQPIELGSKTFIPGFEEALVGANIGDTSINVTFPADYNAAHLAGKDATFNIKVKNIQAKSSAPVDEEFAARIGIADKDVSKVREKVRENMSKYLEDFTKTRLRDQAIEQLYLVNPLDIPSALLDEETHNLIHEKQGHNHGQHHDHGLDAHNHDDISAEEMAKLREEAKKRITISLLLSEIITKNNLKPEQDRVIAKLSNMALMYGGNADFIRKMYQDSKELRQNIQNMVLTDQAADLVVANATINEKQSTFYGIVNPETNQGE
jgi:trigger factor